MGFSFFPQEIQFFDLFTEQYAKLSEAVAALNGIFQEFTDCESKCKTINLLEENGNTISRNIAKQLSLTFITRGHPRHQHRPGRPAEPHQGHQHAHRAL